MNKKTKILLTICGVVTIATAFGIYSFVQYEIRLYNAVALQNTKILILDDFLVKNFTEQVKAYKESLSKTPVAPLSTNNEPAEK